MKRLILAITILLVTTFLGVTSYAATGDQEIDASVVYAFECSDCTDLGGAVGFNLGGGYEMMDNLQGRLDVSYYKYSDSGVDVTLVPIILGLRYYMPVQEGLRVFGQGGLELNMAKGSGGDITENKTLFGFTPGVGIAFQINPQVGIVADARYHILQKWDDASANNFSLQAGVSYKF